MKIVNPLEEVNKFQSTESLAKYLHMNGCKGCDLGFQLNINGCCVTRGNHKSKLMIVGEGPGKEEDATRLPFTGPAGRLLDKIWQAAGWDTNNWYLTNPVLCRPVAPRELKKQNLTPKVEQLRNCRPFLEKQIELLDPECIVTLGKIGTEAILGHRIQRMGDYRGKSIYTKVAGKLRIVFPLYHPAYLLHSKKNSERYHKLRLEMWEDIQYLRKLIDSLKL